MAGKKRRGWGEGRVEQLSSGRWRAVVSAGVVEGKRVRESKTFAVKSDAVAWIASRKCDGRVCGGAAWTVGVWCGHWLEGVKREREYQTWRSYWQRVKNHIRPYLGSLKLTQVTKVRMDQWHTAMSKAGVSAAQQFRAAKTLRAALEAAVRAGLLPSNPAKRSPLPRVRPKEMVAWSRDDLRAFLATEGNHPKWWAAWWLLADSGIRPAELLGLHWSDVDWEAGAVRIRRALVYTDRGFELKAPKTAKGNRVILLSQQTVERLRAHRAYWMDRGRDVVNGPVFPGRRGGYVRPEYLHFHQFVPAQKRVQRTYAVPRIRVYDLRHTCATLLLAAGVNVKVVADRLGHEDPALTLRVYAHAIPTIQEQARKVMAEILTENGTPTAHATADQTT